MQVIHTEIPWRRWLKSSRCLLPGHDSLAELSRQRARELHVGQGRAQLFVQALPLESADKRWPMGEAGDFDGVCGQLRPADRVVLCLDLVDCFSHDISIPRAAIPEIEGVLDLERARVTPFSKDDVYSGWAPLEEVRADGSIMVRHVIIKKTTVAKMRDAIAARDAELIGLMVRDHLTLALPMAIGMDGAPFGRAVMRRWGRIAAVAAAVVLMGSVALAYGLFLRQSQVLADIERRSAVLAKSATAVQDRLKAISAESAELARAQQLIASRPSLVAAIETLSDELPDDTSVEGFTYAGGSVTITGTSETPEPLVALLDETHAFSGVGFSAPVFRNPGENRSHYTLTLKPAQPGVPPR